MTLTAYGPTYRDGVEDGFRLDLATPDDVRRFVELLAEDGVFTAVVEGEHGVMDVHVQDGFGYLLYNGQEMVAAYSVGVASSPPVVASETGFPAGSGVPLDTFTGALIEFLENERLPKLVSWSDGGHKAAPV